jgi:hypothetical protein
MKKSISVFSFIFLLLIVISANVFAVTRSISVKYLAGKPENNWMKEVYSKSLNQHPTIVINTFNDDREKTDIAGAIYNRSGKKIETLVTEENPADILETVLRDKLQKVGFNIVRTTGWNLKTDKIPGYLNADIIVGGRMKAFWVESKAGFLTATIHSKVVWDIVVADIRQKKIIVKGELSGSDTRKSLAHISDYFWVDLQTSISQSLTAAINSNLPID